MLRRFIVLLYGFSGLAALDQIQEGVSAAPDQSASTENALGNPAKANPAKRGRALGRVAPQYSQELLENNDKGRFPGQKTLAFSGLQPFGQLSARTLNARVPRMASRISTMPPNPTRIGNVNMLSYCSTSMSEPTPQRASTRVFLRADDSMMSTNCCGFGEVIGSTTSPWRRP
jgi:hypothetical protein